MPRLLPLLVVLRWHAGGGILPRARRRLLEPLRSLGLPLLPRLPLRLPGLVLPLPAVLEPRARRVALLLPAILRLGLSRLARGLLFGLGPGLSSRPLFICPHTHRRRARAHHLAQRGLLCALRSWRGGSWGAVLFA